MYKLNVIKSRLGVLGAPGHACNNYQLCCYSPWEVPTLHQEKVGGQQLEVLWRPKISLAVVRQRNNKIALAISYVTKGQNQNTPFLKLKAKRTLLLMGFVITPTFVSLELYNLHFPRYFLHSQYLVQFKLYI